LNNSKTAAIGNLRENLERRRVLGSSFAQDAFTRTNAEFAKQADAVTADSFLKSLDATQQLIGQEFTARRGQFQTGLDELNLEASTAATMAGKATEQLGANARTAAQLDFLSNQGKGSFFNNLIAPVAKAAGNSASGFNFNFGGGSSGPDLGGGIWPA